MTHLKTKNKEKSRAPRSRLGALVVISLILASSCKQEEEKANYTVPDHICEVDVDSNLVEAVLPAGEEIRQNNERSSDGYTNCRLSVDDHWGLNTVVYILNSEKDPLVEVLSSRLTTEHAPSSTEADMVLWRGKESAGATASFECRQQDLGSYALLKINIIGQIDDIKDPRMSSIEEFSLNYMQNFRTQYCQDH
ncbi:hypothetical protein AB0O69_18855 [Streptomyces xiamenensis]|uniref:hypothetical protein n=1 Tax=Streptomyces xiamenensis TaxID=408015 RepID=UPI003446C08F